MSKKDTIMLPIMQRISSIQSILPLKTIGTRYILHFDGCCKGNPGDSGAGAIIYKDNEEIWSCSKYLGKGTNNQAEYKGLILGLEKAVELSISELSVFGDSQLVINQVNGIYKVSSPQIKPLYEKVKELKSKIENVEFYHVYRHENQMADKLANDALLMQDHDIMQKDTEIPLLNKTKKKTEVPLEFSSPKTVQLTFPSIFLKKTKKTKK